MSCQSDNEDTANLTRARRGLDLRRFDLRIPAREIRVRLYACEVERAGEITHWLPRATPTDHFLHDSRTKGRQYRDLR